MHTDRCDRSAGNLEVNSPAFLTDVNVFSADWSAGLVSVFLTSDVNLFLAEFVAGAWREVGGKGRLLVLSFPSDALLLVW
jgi:hypothetical protein